MKVNGAIPFTAITGIKEDVACVAVRTTFGMATVAEIGGATLNENMFDAVLGAESVTVTV